MWIRFHQSLRGSFHTLRRCGYEAFRAAAGGAVSCTAVDVVGILENSGSSWRALEISAEAEQEKDPPWTFRKIHLTYKLKGEGLTAKNVEQAITLSEEKYCSVAATVRGVAETTTSFEIYNQPRIIPRLIILCNLLQFKNIPDYFFITSATQSPLWRCSRNGNP